MTIGSALLGLFALLGWGLALAANAGMREALDGWRKALDVAGEALEAEKVARAHVRRALDVADDANQTTRELIALAMREQQPR